MRVSELLAGTDVSSPIAPQVSAAEVKGLAYDSRKAGPGYLFFAFAGAKADGREFARDAMAKGALAVVSELPQPEGFRGPWIQTAHARHTLAIAAGRFWDHPDRQLRLTGITGTNGKTTTSYLIDSIYREAGHITALIGTIEYRLAGRKLPAVNTTPESLDIFDLLYQLQQEGGSHATMEISSHALALGRVYAMQFQTAVFTNLTRDHLDFHQTMEEYFAAKQQLFLMEGAEGPRFAVLNHDDEYGRAVKTKPGTEVLSYGFEKGASFRAVRINTGFQGLRFEVQHGGQAYPVESALAGRINVSNILAAWGSAFADGIPPETIAAGIRALHAVPGRFQRVDQGQPFLVAVDYAHTDDALRNTLATARALTGKRVITVFGCGGDRDRTKRPLMGLAAAESSDFVVLTSDNPRSEDPLSIINDALVGLRRRDTRHIIEPDRAKAIEAALNEAHSGDVVVIAGKGHEDYQVLADRTIHFSDTEVATDVLNRLGYRKES